MLYPTPSRKKIVMVFGKTLLNQDIFKKKCVGHIHIFYQTLLYLHISFHLSFASFKNSKNLPYDLNSQPKVLLYCQMIYSFPRFSKTSDQYIKIIC